jgi:hypothetical protein
MLQSFSFEILLELVKSRTASVSTCIGPGVLRKLSKEGLKVDPKKIEAITEMPASTDRHRVQRLLGMINYVQKFAPGLSELTAPIRDLLKSDLTSMKKRTQIFVMVDSCFIIRITNCIQ